MKTLNEKLIIWNDHIEKTGMELTRVIRQRDFMEGVGAKLLSDEEMEILAQARNILWRVENDLVFEIE